MFKVKNHLDGRASHFALVNSSILRISFFGHFHVVEIDLKRMFLRRRFIYPRHPNTETGVWYDWTPKNIPKTPNLRRYDWNTILLPFLVDFWSPHPIRSLRHSAN